jgi:3-hydroxyacyl-[acyl-carrier-protein] dehydratase
MHFSVPANHPCLPGHFPGNPLVPGVVILDRVIAAIEAANGRLGALRLPQVKFVRPLLPEQTATIELEGERPRWRFRVLQADGALIASGEVMTA